MENTVSELEYLGMNVWQKFGYNFCAFFRKLPAAFLRIFTVFIPRIARKIWGALKSLFTTLFNAMVHGDWKTRLSFLVMGSSQLARKQIMRGILFLAFELLFILYMWVFGAGQLALFGTLGRWPKTVAGWDDQGNYIPARDGDNSILILLYGVLTIIFIVAFVYAWYANIKSGYAAQQYMEARQHLPTAKEDLNALADSQYHKTLLTGPLIGLTIFTILPIIFMAFLAFTNCNGDNFPPTKLFTWTWRNGDIWANFKALFSGTVTNNIAFGQLFGRILLWTVVWAIFATFTNYILGMLVALVINKKGIRLKKLWRTILIMTVAVPQFVSLLLVSQMFSLDGIINKMLGTTIRWLDGGETLARFMVILINIWVGIPFTMLMVTGILMNIPADLYESAKIDGAGPVRMYLKITLPYVWHVTTPSLISNFIGNLNNFGVIYLLTGGGPTINDGHAGGAGHTDLLITWLFKLTTDSDKLLYNIASVVSIMMFIITAVISLIVYNRSKAVKNEEDFM